MIHTHIRSFGLSLSLLRKYCEKNNLPHLNKQMHNDDYINYIINVYFLSIWSICLSVQLSINPSVHLSICPSVHLSICTGICLSISLSVSVPFHCPSVFLHVYFFCPSVNPSTCPYVFCMSLCSSVCLSFCVYVYVSLPFFSQIKRYDLPFSIVLHTQTNKNSDQDICSVWNVKKLQ